MRRRMNGSAGVSASLETFFVQDKGKGELGKSEASQTVFQMC